MAWPSLDIGARLRVPCVEPKKRMVAGRYGWAIHRFPIKDGVTLAHVWSEGMRETMARPPYFARLAVPGGPVLPREGR